MANKFKTKKFWVSLAGMIILLLQLLGLKIDVPYVNEIVNSVCAICVFIGLLDGGPTASEQSQEASDDQAEDGEQSDTQDETTE